MNNRTFIITPEHTDRVKRSLYEYLKSLDYSKKWRVVISKYVNDKTAAQRGFLHGVLLKTLSEETDYTVEELKYHMRAEAFGSYKVTINGTTREHVKSSETAKRAEYSALIETTYREASRMGVTLPPADRFHK